MTWTERDEARLTDEQRTTFALLKSGAASRAFAARAMWGVVALIFGGLGFLIGAALYVGQNNTDGHLDWFADAGMPISMLLLMGGTALAIARTVKSYNRRVEQERVQLEEFKSSIQARRATVSESETYMTTRQSDHLWYGTHGELNWTHRVQGQQMGFEDADSYVNNWLESE